MKRREREEKERAERLLKKKRRDDEDDASLAPKLSVPVSPLPRSYCAGAAELNLGKMSATSDKCAIIAHAHIFASRLP